MSQPTIALLQSLLVFLQIANAGIETVTKNPLIALLLTAFLGALQFYLNALGNASITEPVKARLAELDNLHASAVSTVLAQAATPQPAPVPPAPRKQW